MLVEKLALSQTRVIGLVTHLCASVVAPVPERGCKFTLSCLEHNLQKSFGILHHVRCF